MMRERLFQNLALLAGSVFFTVLLLEIFLRFLPVNDGFRFQPVDADHPVFHAFPDRTMTSSKGWNLYNARKIDVNNAGFRSDLDYMAGDTRPLIAVIGDSYVEAVQVDYADTFYARLDRELGEGRRVYSFGFSGAPLSQYLAWARYAKEVFQPEYMTFVIVGNDFDESVGWRGRRDGFHYFEHCEEDGRYCLELNPYQVGFFRPVVNMSALARYMIVHLNVLAFFENLKVNMVLWGGKSAEKSYVANVDAQVDAQRLQDSQLAVDLFFRYLSEYAQLPPDRINFLIDGRIYHMPEAEFAESFFGQMRRYFMRQARQRGYSVIDMKPVFSRDFKEHGRHFEGVLDGHWNALGHELVFGELYKYYRFQP